MKKIFRALISAKTFINNTTGKYCKHSQSFNFKYNPFIYRVIDIQAISWVSVVDWEYSTWWWRDSFYNLFWEIPKNNNEGFQLKDYWEANLDKMGRYINSHGTLR